MQGDLIHAIHCTKHQGLKKQTLEAEVLSDSWRFQRPLIFAVVPKVHFIELQPQPAGSLGGALVGLQCLPLTQVRRTRSLWEKKAKTGSCCSPLSLDKDQLQR